jgi:hypothetical protein
VQSGERKAHGESLVEGLELLIDLLHARVGCGPVAALCATQKRVVMSAAVVETDLEGLMR